jgi:tetratricopeptide (TPR) repeat protein
LRSAGRHADAEGEYRHAIELIEAGLGPDHPNLAFALNGLAEVLRQRGGSAEAAALLGRALAIRRAALGERHPLVASTLSVLALLYRDQADYARAEALALEAVAIRKEAVGDYHPRYAHELMALGSIRTLAGRHTAAEPTLRQALAIIEAAAADVEPRVIADARLALARALVLGGRPEEGRPHAEEALRIAAESLPAGGARKRLALELLATAHEAENRPADAAAYRQRLASLP